MFERFVIPDLAVICKRVLQRHKSDIEALNKSQLSTGTRADGTQLPPYSTPYLRVRRKYGRPTSPKDLNLTGEFYDKFYSLYFDKFFEIGSRSRKEGFLESNWGELHGLTEESIEKLLWDIGVADEIVTEFITELFK